MFKLSVAEIFLRAIPETLIFLMGMYLFSKTPLDKKKFSIISVVLCMGIVIIRKLPISYGIHTILIIILGIFLGSTWGKVEVTSAIRAAIMTTLIQSICEGINALWIQYGLQKNIEVIFENPMSKILYGIPSLVFTSMIMWMFYIKQYKSNEMQEEHTNL